MLSLFLNHAHCLNRSTKIVSIINKSNMPASRLSGIALFLEREVRGSNLGPAKLDTLLPSDGHRCDIPL